MFTYIFPEKYILYLFSKYVDIMWNLYKIVPTWIKVVTAKYQVIL